MYLKTILSLLALFLTLGLLCPINAQSSAATAITPESYLVNINETLKDGDFDLVSRQYDSLYHMAAELKDTLHMVTAQSNKGELLFMLGKIDEAKQAFIRSLEYSSFLENQDLRGFDLIRMASINKHTGDNEGAFVYLRKALDLLPLTNNENIKYQLYNQFGILYDAIGKGDSAVHYYLKTLDYVKDEEAYVKGAIYNNLGKSFSYRNNFQKAIDYYEKAEATLNPEEYPIAYSSAMANKALSLHNKGNDVEAEIEVRKAIALLSTKKNNRNQIMNYSILASILLSQNQLEAAKAAIEEISKLGEVKDKEYRPIFLLTQIEVLLLSNKLSEIPKVLKSAKASIADNNFLQYQIKYHRLHAAYLKQIGQYEAAYDAIGLHNTVKDSLYRISQSNIIHDLEMNYETEQKELRIAQLEIEESLQQAKISRQQWIITLTSLILVLFGFLGYYVLRQNSRIKEQNQLIQKALGEKNILLKEIHHRVKNNLQVISSLLGIQSRKIKDKAALEAITEGRTRVETMSLIHQNLYKKDNLTGIEIHDYLGKLAESLFATYNIDTAQVELELDIDELILDVESVIPIGLIINELISNALKYAFIGKDGGKIWISVKDTAEGLILIVRDNGVGIADLASIHNGESFGYDLIDAFKVKLKADLDITVQDGTQINMLIRNYKKVA